MECSSLGCSHETEFIEYIPIEEEMVGYEFNDFQHMNDEDSFEDQILKQLEEIIVEVIIGTLHCELMVMLGSQYIISPHEPNVWR